MRMGWVLVALWCVVAIAVVVATGPEHLSREHSKQTLSPPEGATRTPRVA